MTTLTTETPVLMGMEVSIDEESLTVHLVDGRTISVPIVWFPRLAHAHPEERTNWRWIGKGLGIHWPDLDEDISIENLMLGRRSGESQASFKLWLESRNQSPQSTG